LVGIYAFDQEEVVSQIKTNSQKERPQQRITDPPAFLMRKKKNAREKQLKDNDHKKGVRKAKAHSIITLILHL
jgi:hypothetical protein